MKIYTVSLFGHREVENPKEIEIRLVRVIGQLVTNHDMWIFLLGGKASMIY